MRSKFLHFYLCYFSNVMATNFWSIVLTRNSISVTDHTFPSQIRNQWIEPKKRIHTEKLVIIINFSTRNRISSTTKNLLLLVKFYVAQEILVCVLKLIMNTNIFLCESFQNQKSLLSQEKYWENNHIFCFSK